MCIKKILAYRTAIWNKQKRNVHSIFGRKEFGIWSVICPKNINTQKGVKDNIYRGFNLLLFFPATGSTKYNF